MTIRRKITRSLNCSDVQNGQRGEIFKFVTSLANKFSLNLAHVLKSEFFRKFIRKFSNNQFFAWFFSW